MKVNIECMINGLINFCLSRLAKIIFEVMAASNSGFDVKSSNAIAFDATVGDGSVSYTPLHRAALEDKTDDAKKLCLSNFVDVDCVDNWGDTPLHVACMYGRLKMVRFLLERGADVSAVGRYGFIPLHLAAGMGYRKIVKKLMECRSYVSARDYEEDTPLHLAAQGGHIETMKCLLKNGAQPKALNKRKETPLEVAKRYRHDSFVKMFNLYVFKLKRKAFDAKFEDKKTREFKPEIRDRLFGIEGVSSLGSGVNKAWRESGEYGGLCIKVGVTMDPEEFKTRYPEYANEPFFIFQDGGRAVLQ